MNSKVKTIHKKNREKASFIHRDENIKPAIKMENINFAFGIDENRKQVLFDNTLELFPGEIVILTGPSGSGKTTLLTLIGALRSVQEGSMKVLGHELSGLGRQKQQEIRKNIGFIFQAHNLFDSLTAFQTLSLTMQLYPYSKKQFQNKPMEILEELGLKDRMHYKPEKLSGGQRQRVAIGRALINHPKLILADEPTAALDKDNGRKMVEILRKRAKEEGCTILIVTHDNRILDVADRILKMVDGYIISDILVKDSIAISQFLEKCSVFKDVNPTSMAGIANKMKPEKYHPGDMIIKQGDPGDKFYLIRSGRVEVRIETQGKQRSVKNLKQGDFFGEMALIKNEPRAASIIALEPTDLYFLPKIDFNEVIQSSSSLEEQLKKAYFYQ
jgi:putative ABC transport system ATP-binding protein